MQEGIKISPELLRSFHFDLPTGKLTEEYYQMLLKKEQEQQKKEREKQKQQDQKQNENENEQSGSNQSDEEISDNSQLEDNADDLVNNEQNQEDGSDNNSSNGQGKSSGSSSSSSSFESQANQQTNSSENTNESDECGTNGNSDVSVDNTDEELSDEETLLQPGCGNCGSCADGVAKDYEEKAEGSGLSKSKIEEAKQKTAERILQMAPGKVPGGWKRWAEDISKPKVNWRKELSTLVRNAMTYTVGAVDYSYQRPSRRQSAFSNIVMPGMRKPKLAIAVVIDTSGSMNEKAISQVLSEVDSILKSSGQTESITVIACDAEVHFQKKVFKKSQVQALGGGGTNMCVGIETALKAKPRPQVVVVITDGDSPWPSKPIKNARLVIALTENTYSGYLPKWAKVVLVNEF
ncbi:MAG: hypothetical protein FD167_3447 [bacterium]|nr:MAG: hypothetical protein FD167_3447 [bacterium]